MNQQYSPAGATVATGTQLFKFASPKSFFLLAGKLIPWFGAAAAVLGAIGLYIGLFLAPTDHQQGEAYRIIFVHVPAAWMSNARPLAINASHTSTARSHGIQIS